MKLNDFLALSVEEVAAIVRDRGPRVVVFPINGTRRWMHLEHGSSDNFYEDYMIKGSLRHIELYKLFFDHGIEYLLTPIFGPDILERGEAYMEMSSAGMKWMAEHEFFTDFYNEYQVHLRFYGEYQRYFDNTPYAYLSDVFRNADEATQQHNAHKLYLGVCGHDATHTTMRVTLDHHQTHGTLPTKEDIIRAYYGEAVPPVDIYIGSDKFAVFDAPLLLTGFEDLYFMVMPSSYLSVKQLRTILYDHLFARHSSTEDYDTFTNKDWDEMRSYYYANQDHTFGIGRVHAKHGYWYPTGHVDIPPNFDAQDR